MTVSYHQLLPNCHFRKASRAPKLSTVVTIVPSSICFLPHIAKAAKVSKYRMIISIMNHALLPTPERPMYESSSVLRL